MLHIVIIANPAAGGGRFARIERRMIKELRSGGFSVDVERSTGPGDCESFARAAPKGAIVCAAGGDGTVSEVVNGVLSGNGKHVVTVIPCGTGNDFAMAIGLPEEPLKAVDALRTAVERRVDCGRVSWTGPLGVRSRYFCNAAGIGLDAAASRCAVRWKSIFGKASYTLAAVATLLRWPDASLRVDYDHPGDGVIELDAGLFACACNGARSGGGFLLAPEATVTDGVLDICVVRKPGLMRALRLLPRVRRGTHTEAEEVTLVRTRRASITFDRVLDVHVDGEILGDRVRSLRVEILKGALAVFAPPL